jgi:multidrug resistance efflux pump
LKEDRTLATQDTTPAASDAARPRSRRRTWFILAVLLVVLLVVAVGGFFYLRNASLYVTTDDALVNSNLTPVAATSSGTLETWLVEPGATVVTGQTIGFVRPPLSGSAGDSVKIAAPVDGTVIRIDGQVGQSVGPFQPLAYVANLDNLTIWAYIDETQIHRIQAGQPVDVTVDATGGHTYHGSVKRIMPATASQFSLLPSSDRTTANFTKVIQRIIVDIDLGNTGDLGLYPGMSAYVRIHAPR